MARDVSQHPDLLKQLSSVCNNTIELLTSEHPIDRYTCLMHVLDFAEKTEYVDIAKLDKAHAGVKFAHWLLDKNKLQETSQADVKENDIVFYFNNSEFKHTDVLRNSKRVTSKWGVGHLYEHDVFEVPSSYGETVRFLVPLNYDDAYYYFTEFAEENGVKYNE